MMIMTMLMINFEDDKMPSFLSIHHLLFISFGDENALLWNGSRCVVSYYYFFLKKIYSVSEVISFLNQEDRYCQK